MLARALLSRKTIPMTIHEKLKEQFLTGMLDAYELHIKLLELDQADSRHLYAEENLSVLCDKAVERKMGEQNYRQNYLRLLAFTRFHVVQRYATSTEMHACNRNADLQGQLLCAIGESMEGSSEVSWISYLKATESYFRKNIQKLKEVIPLIEGKNKDCAQRLLNGLETYGEPNYRRDYLGEIKK